MSKITIAAVGGVNAGKSAFLAALADDRMLFPVDELPGTTRVITASPVGAWTLVDTPGLDLSSSGRNSVMEAVADVDVIAFCHNLRCGELRPWEIESLAELANYSRLLIVVLTNGENLADAGQAERLDEFVARQVNGIREMLNPPPGWNGETPEIRSTHIVDTYSYWRTRSRLVEDGYRLGAGIPQIRAELESLAPVAGRNE